MKSNAMTQISDLLDFHCSKCDKKRSMEKEFGPSGQYARIDGYCNRECEIGKELQQLGKQLGKGAPQHVTGDRKIRRAIAIVN